MKTNSRNILFFLFIIVLVGCNQKHSDKSHPKQPTTSNVPDSDDPVEVRPQIVRVEKIDIRNGVKYLQVGNSNGTFSIAGNQEQENCITPAPETDYFLFTKQTRWRFSGAKGFATLELFQNWSIRYNNEENIALVPAIRDKNGEWRICGDWGIYWLESWRAK
jgi:hypothetical protein